VVAAVERRGKKLVRIRLQVIPDCSSTSLLSFIEKNVEPGSRLLTDGWKGYTLNENMFVHFQMLQSKAKDKESILPGVHLVISILKRLILSTHQGRFDPKYLQHYLDEFVFRFNRRASRFIGKKFMRIIQQVVVSAKTTIQEIRSATMATSHLKKYTWAL